MFKLTFGEMTILHHNTKIGDNLLNSASEHVGLFGHNKVAILFKFKSMSIPNINKVNAPSWAKIQAIKPPEDLDTVRHATPNYRHFTSTITIPPFLTKALVTLQGPSTSDVYMEILRASEAFDTKKEDSVLASSEIKKDISPTYEGCIITTSNPYRHPHISHPASQNELRRYTNKT